MYNRFFGFKERPFKLVPNPEYLFLSRIHEEALAHLHYAVHSGDGFVEITGEVGTGKTTLCRMFLENLPKDTEAAYIFNPMLDAKQLLKAINDEFGITTPEDSIKDLIDALNQFLIEKRSQNKNIILLIDEAQNLKTEILEQLRLLSNLETTSSKLIQIILVGQPELGDLLDSHELRQLSQRITLSCHLVPLTSQETTQYIGHRISIASHKPGATFTRQASKAIYQYANGVPRLINIACDRALLTAYGLNQKKITLHIAKRAIRELSTRKNRVAGPFTFRWSSALIIAVACVAAVMSAFLTLSLVAERTGGPRPVEAIFHKITAPTEKKVPEVLEPGNQERIVVSTNDTLPSVEEKDKTTPLPFLEPSDHKIEIIVEEEVLTEGDPISMEAFETRLKTMGFRKSRSDAAANALELWNPGFAIPKALDRVEDDREFFRLAANKAGLKIQSIEGSIQLIQHLNLPAMLEFYLPGSLFPKYMVLTGLDEDLLSLVSGEDELKTTHEVINRFWNKTAHIPWKNFYNYQELIHVTSPRNAILTLKMHLKEIGFDHIEINSVYDTPTSQAVGIVQQRNGLKMDGYVGPLTQIAMYNEKKTLEIPHLTR